MYTPANDEEMEERIEEKEGEVIPPPLTFLSSQTTTGSSPLYVISQTALGDVLRQIETDFNMSSGELDHYFLSNEEQE